MRDTEVCERYREQALREGMKNNFIFVFFFFKKKSLICKLDVFGLFEGVKR